MVQPNPLPAAPPPAAALTSGVMMLSVKALISVLKASATTRPTAITIRSPCIRKFLKPFSIGLPSALFRHAIPRLVGRPGHHSNYRASQSRGSRTADANACEDNPVPSRETIGTLLSRARRPESDALEDREKSL